MNIFSGIISFFQNLFSDDPEKDKRSRLNRVQAGIKQHSPTLYKNKQLTSHFGSLLFTLYKILSPFTELMNKTVNNINEKMSKRAWERVYCFYLGDDFLNLRSQFSKKMIIERLKNASNIRSEKEKISSEFNRLLDFFEQKNIAALNMEISAVYSLANLCTFNFEPLLSLFDSSIAFQSASYKPSFRNCDIEKAIASLEDFYFVYADFKPELITGHFFSAFFASDSEQNQKLVQRGEEMLKKLNILITKKLPPQILQLIIQAGYEDPGYIPKHDHISGNILGDYRQKLIEQFNRDKESVSQTIQQSSFNSEQQALLGNIDLLEPEGYNTYLNEEIDAANCDTELSHIKAFSILKTFLIAKFNKDYLDSLKQLVLEGYFQDKSFQQQFSDYVYRCENSLVRIRQFEKHITDRDSQLSIHAIGNLLDRIKKGKNLQNSLLNMISVLNKKSLEIIENEVNYHFALFQVAKAIFEDSKKSSPSYIVNIKAIVTTGGESALKSLRDYLESMTHFYKLMKNFVIIKSAIQDKIK